jgi:hypothetical protein
LEEKKLHFQIEYSREYSLYKTSGESRGRTHIKELAMKKITGLAIAFLTVSGLAYAGTIDLNLKGSVPAAKARVASSQNSKERSIGSAKSQTRQWRCRAKSPSNLWEWVPANPPGFYGASYKDAPGTHNCGDGYCVDNCGHMWICLPSQPAHAYGGC